MGKRFSCLSLTTPPHTLQWTLPTTINRTSWRVIEHNNCLSPRKWDSCTSVVIHCYYKVHKTNTITQEVMGNINLTGLVINCCLSLTTSSSIPCEHSDREGESMVFISYQGYRNGPISFNYTVGGLVEPHRDGHCKRNGQSCMTILVVIKST